VYGCRRSIAELRYFFSKLNATWLIPQLVNAFISVNLIPTLLHEEKGDFMWTLAFTHYYNEAAIFMLSSFSLSSMFGLFFRASVNNDFALALSPAFR
jgi:hypothetical protein